MAKTRTKAKLSDIAARAKISIPAVSMALADHPRISLRTKRRVWQISEELGYRTPKATAEAKPGATSSDATTTVKRIGLACLHGNFATPVNSALMMHLTTYTSRAGIAMETFAWEDISNPKQTAQRVVQFAQSLDGVILTGYVSPPTVTQLAAAGTPFVVLGDPLEGASADHVTFDFTEAGHRLTAHHLQHGQRRIAFFCETKLRPGSANARWHDGYLIAHHHAAALTPDPQLTVVIDDVDSNVVYRQIPDQLRRLLALPPAEAPGAFVTPNPFIAEILVNELRHAGRPVEVAATSFNPPSPSLQGRPLVILSLETLAEQTFRRLLYVCRYPHRTPLRIIVPFDTQNLV